MSAKELKLTEEYGVASPVQSPKNKRTYVVLQCGTAPPDVINKFGSYDRMFVEWLQDGDDETWEVYKVYEDHFPNLNEIDKYAAVVITGSPADAHSTVPWVEKLKHLIRLFYSNKTRILGVCFGHQVTSIALGGNSNRAPSGWESGLKSVVPNESFFQTFPTAKYQTFRIVESHQDQVLEIPPEGKLLASSAKCKHEMYQVPAENPHVLCIQGHPEFSLEFATALYGSMAARGVLPPEVADAALQSTREYQLEHAAHAPEIKDLLKTFLKR